MSDAKLATTPQPPYYAVIFSSVRNVQPDDRYDETAKRMLELAATQPGFLGVDDAREGVGITVSYWSDEAADCTHACDSCGAGDEHSHREPPFSRELDFG